MNLDLCYNIFYRIINSFIKLVKCRLHLDSCYTAVRRTDIRKCHLKSDITEALPKQP